MDREGPSRTAWSAAGHRAAHQIIDAAVVFDDPLAVQIIGLDVEVALRQAREDPSRRGMRLFIACGHRYAADIVAAAATDGTRQVVVLGAGLDTTAYRPSARIADRAVYEVDNPATQAWKLDRVEAAGLTPVCALRHVAVDFEREPLAERLQQEGFRADRPAVFVWLGVVLYLTREAVRATLDVISGVPGSSVIFD